MEEGGGAVRHFPDDHGEQDLAVVIKSVDRLARDNTHYRRVISTTAVQVVLYALAEDAWLPMESHCEASQIFHVVQGEAVLTIGDRKGSAKPGDVIVVAPGTPHRVEPGAAGALKMWSVYTTPLFERAQVDARQPHAPRVGAPVMALGRGFAAGMTINAAAHGAVCVARDGAPVCQHVHTDLSVLTTWLAANATGAVCPTCDAISAPCQHPEK